MAGSTKTRPARKRPTPQATTDGEPLVVVAEPLPAGGYVPPVVPPRTTVGAAEPPAPENRPSAPVADAPAPWVRPWRITFLTRSWTDQDVKGRHLALVAATHDRDSWDDMSPWRGPVRLCSWIHALLVADGIDPEVAMAVISNAKAADLAAAITDR